ncbi:hypothetical protein EEL30_00025 (plasmid) [Brevibacillus laterosporus]|uniref:Uncharacterized protein n=1 Tax=Brevibacillus laterosporus TaxID=1465 RepID=A0A518V1P0_BRELA|nr:hypothetical protein EEL30_00025 [Brevibacillus laterosporus]
MFSIKHINIEIYFNRLVEVSNKIFEGKEITVDREALIMTVKIPFENCTEIIELGCAGIPDKYRVDPPSDEYGEPYFYVMLQQRELNLVEITDDLFNAYSEREREFVKSVNNNYDLSEIERIILTFNNTPTKLIMMELV